jgi:tetratricopeptide (TPR) repeat protein
MADTGRLDELKRKFEGNPRRYFAPLANEYRKAGDPDLAIELCRTYLPKQPTHMSGYIVYGQALQDAGHTDESEAVFKQALTLDPENIIALRNLGDMARNAGDSAGAIRWYGKVLELDPRNEEVTAFIASLAHPDSTPAAPISERKSPPAIRPEPEPDASAVRLEDIVSQPDVAQTPFVIDGGELSDEPFEATGWPAAPESGLDSELEYDSLHSLVPDPAADAQTQPVVQGPWHPPVADEAPDIARDSESESDTAPESQTEQAAGQDAGQDERSESLRLTDFMPDESADFAPVSDDELVDSDAEHVPAATAPLPITPGRDESPFVTETMAELYMQQGLRGEALSIYRQLALKRDDARLRQRIAEIESQQTAVPRGETVRAFFARIGSVHPRTELELARDQDHASSLSALFANVRSDARDMGAAERLSGAFADWRPGNSRS